MSSGGTLFTYRALDANGVTRSGTLVAPDEAAAARQLLEQGLRPFNLESKAVAVAAKPGKRGPVGIADQLVLIQELSTLLGAGISLSEALPSLAQAYAAQALGPALASVEQAVRAGQRLSEAFRGSRLGLPPYVLALVEAGEASGALAAALADAATQMEYERRIGTELRNALVYPTVLVVAGTLAVLTIFVGVVPRFAGILKSSRADVPALSRALIEAGLYVKQHLLGFGLGAGALALLVAMALSNPALRTRLLNRLAGLPLLGPWLTRVDIGRWATVLGALLGNRVPIITAVSLSTGALRLPQLRDDLGSAARELERGLSLSDVLGAKGWFPPARLNLIRVGERSGELPRMLATLGAMETEAARTLQKRVLTLIEPAAILIIGAVIGFIMVAVMMAITSLNSVAV